jgi:hypothetical protein
MLGTALEGRSHDEVADALGLSHGAVRGLIYRARATLRAAAAVVTPSPLIHWAARHGAGTGRSAVVVEALAGGSSVGIGGLIVKGGAVVAAAGAIATAAGIADHGSHPRRTLRGLPSARPEGWRCRRRPWRGVVVGGSRGWISLWAGLPVRLRVRRLSVGHACRGRVAGLRRVRAWPLGR